MARLAATVFGLSVFRREFNDLAQEYAEQTFAKNNGFACIQAGTFTSLAALALQPDKFRLCISTVREAGRFPLTMFSGSNQRRLLHRKDGWCTILAPETTPLDEVLGIPVFGNLSLFKNRVLCLDEQKICCFADTHAFKDVAAVFHSDELLPFGLAATLLEALRRLRTGVRDIHMPTFGRGHFVQ